MDLVTECGYEIVAKQVNNVATGMTNILTVVAKPTKKGRTALFANDDRTMQTYKANQIIQGLLG